MNTRVEQFKCELVVAADFFGELPEFRRRNAIGSGILYAVSSHTFNRTRLAESLQSRQNLIALHEIPCTLELCNH
jgi:hypothetical protein